MLDMSQACQSGSSSRIKPPPASSAPLLLFTAAGLPSPLTLPCRSHGFSGADIRDMDAHVVHAVPDLRTQPVRAGHLRCVAGCVLLVCVCLVSGSYALAAAQSVAGK